MFPAWRLGGTQYDDPGRKGSQSGANRRTMMLWMASSNLFNPNTSTSPPSVPRSTSMSWALLENNLREERDSWGNLNGVVAEEESFARVWVMRRAMDEVKGEVLIDEDGYSRRWAMQDAKTYGRFKSEMDWYLSPTYKGGLQFRCPWFLCKHRLRRTENGLVNNASYSLQAYP